jgi:Zn-dependent peptidase ImmA (M78 family)
MTGDQEALLDAVFGPGSGDNPENRARQSSQMFVRGLDLLTFDHSAEATGRRLAAHEALDAYGFDVLASVALDGSAVITSTVEAAGNALRHRRKQLGLSIRTVASRSGMSLNIVEALEQSKRRPVREYERVARALGLDERAISFRSNPGGNEKLAVRLRTLSESLVSLSESSVGNLAEAAWVAMTQVRLESLLGLDMAEETFEPSGDFGGFKRPPYAAGYDLANRVRYTLGLGESPIPSMRALAEETLRIPVVQTRLDERIAGATVDFGTRRAVVINISGMNSQAMVRRSTVAHELCHILFDPASKLDTLRVDEYDELNRRADTLADPVEQRANAFAVQLLAPQEAVVERFKSRNEDLLTAVLDHFGLSFTAGRYQVWNGLGRDGQLEDISAPNRPPESDWEARESYTLDYHPIRQVIDRPSRAGRFSAVAVRAANEGLVSWDTVAEWLSCSIDEAKRATDAMRDLYRTVF